MPLMSLVADFQQVFADVVSQIGWWGGEFALRLFREFDILGVAIGHLISAEGVLIGYVLFIQACLVSFLHINTFILGSSNQSQNKRMEWFPAALLPSSCTAYSKIGQTFQIINVNYPFYFQTLPPSPHFLILFCFQALNHRVVFNPHLDCLSLFYQQIIKVFLLNYMLALSEDNFKVLIRVRPLNGREKQQIEAYEQSHSKKMKGSGGKMVKMSPAAYSFYTKFYNCNIDEIIKIQKKNHTIAVADPEYKNTDRRMKPYTFSGVYDVQDKNATIFSQDLKDHVSTVLQGYNCTILAYGITGSGKTYTVFGPTHKRYSTMSSSNFNTFNANVLEQSQQEIEGISYLTFEYLLKQKQRLWAQTNTKVTYKVSFVQIYNENVRDLLGAEKQQNKFLNVVEDYKGNTAVSDVNEVNIETIEQVYQCINAGNAKRAFASTMANQYSSRSHAILQLMVQVQKPNMEKTISKLYIIDLAGSQKLQTLNCSKKMQQGANINRSLLALGNCINLLAQNSRKNTITHIPYRDSKLTRMLKDSLGGNTKTIMIACISPNPFLIDQTMTTLNYAMRAQGIKKKIIRNQVDYEQKQEYLCLKCKKSCKFDQEHNQMDDRKSQKQVLCERPSNLNNMRSSLELNSSPKKVNMKKVEQKMQLLENIYEDIINNIKEAQSIKSFGSYHIMNDPEWLKIKCVNEEQRIRLKQVLFDTFKSAQTEKQTTSGSLFSLGSDRILNSYKLPSHSHENKQNQEFISKDQAQNKSLSQSKSRRRRSHNKFQIVRKSEQDCKTIDFD